MTPQKRNIVLALGSLAVAGAALAFIAFGQLGDNLVYYWSPAELVAQGNKAFGPTIRLGGIVAPGTIEWNSSHTALNFDLAENEKPDAVRVAVHCEEVPPQMFREKIGVVVEGTYDSSKVFKSSRLMVNHSNEYKAPKEGDDPKKWRESLSDPQAAR